MRQSWNSNTATERAMLTGLDIGQPYWHGLPHSDLQIARKPARRSYDMVVIGAGLTGALLAEALSSQGRSLLVIDRRMPFSGGTAASSAIVYPGFDMGLDNLTDQVGQGPAEHVWHRAEQAVEKLLALIAHLNIACGLERKRSLSLAGDREAADRLEREARIRNLAGIRTQFIAREGLMALLSPLAATLNPVQLTAGLLAHANRRGAEIVGNVEILDARQSGGRIHLLTSEGDFLSAGHAIFCTGCEVPDCFPEQASRQIPVTALASRPGLVETGWLGRHVVRMGGADDLHIRTTDDGRLIVHCAEAQGKAPAWSPVPASTRYRQLADRVSNLLNIDIGEPDYGWGGTLSASPLGLPVIARLPDQQQAHAVLGYGSNGMTFSQIAADIVLAEIEGRSDPDAALFSLSLDEDRPLPV